MTEPHPPTFHPVASEASGQLFGQQKEWFDVFDQESNQKAVEAQGIIDGINSYPVLVTNIKDQRRPFRVLLIGPGEGKAEVPVLRHIANLRGNQGFEVECVEPSENAEAEFNRNLQANGLNGVKPVWRNQRFEDFKPENQYDLVLCVQAFQYIEDLMQDAKSDAPNSSLAKMKKATGPQGACAIVSLSSAGDVWSVRTLGRLSSKAGWEEHSSADVAEDMMVRHIEGKFVSRDWTLNISSFFPGYAGVFQSSEDAMKHFNPDEKGKKLLSFLLRESWDQSNQFKNVVKPILGSIFYSGIEDTSSGKMLGGVDDFIWITDLSSTDTTLDLARKLMPDR